jgi:hypothetical protein
VTTRGSGCGAALEGAAASAIAKPSAARANSCSIPIEPDDPRDSLPYWFDLACKDPEWIRLLEWEALQFGQDGVIDEANRRDAASDALGRIQLRQKRGHLSDEFASPQVLLAMVALTWFPLAFPQLTRLITGQAVASGRFQQAQREFLRRFAAAFKGAASVALVGCMLSALAGCSRKTEASSLQKKGQSAAVPVLVARAETKDVPVTLRNIGNVEAYATVTVRSQRACAPGRSVTTGVMIPRSITGAPTSPCFSCRVRRI